MILNKYDEIMDKIVVTPEMQERILKNIRETDLKKKRKMIPFRKAQKYFSIAACLTVLIIGAMSFALWNQSGMGQGNEEEPGVEATYGGIIEQENREALEQAVGFSVPELANLPFDVTEISYLSYWNEMAEIEYCGEAQNIFFRKAALTQESGDEDISGDYSEYEHEKQITIKGLQITIKGNGENVSLAIWQDEAYAYSIMGTDGITQGEMEQLIESIY